MSTKFIMVLIAGLGMILALGDLSATPIESGQVVSGSIDSPGDTDTITFTAAEGDTVQISQSATGGDLGIKTELFPPSGPSLGTSTFDSVSTYSLSQSGTYSIHCRDWVTTYTGTFNISLLRMVGYPLSPADPEIGPVAVGEGVAGTIAPVADLDAATFYGQSGDTITISQSATGGDLGIKTELFSPSGSSLGTSTFDSVRTYSLSQSGTYSILCRDWVATYTGTYRISTQIVAGPSMINVPHTPTGLQVSRGGYDGYILVNWDSADQAEGYDIWRKEGDGEYSQLIKNNSETTYQDYAVQGGREYTYKVRSRNWYAVSSFSTPGTGWLWKNPVGLDYNGDGTSDIAIYRPTSGLWAVKGITRAYFGSSSDLPVPRDYTGDGTTNIAIFRESSGLWAVSGGARTYFGGSGDLPIPGDYAGDGTAAIGIYRSASGLWAIKGITRTYFGSSSDEPLPGYYGPNGKKSIGIFRPASGLWALKGVTRAYFGGSSDSPVPGDYDGSGSWGMAVYRPTSGLWAIKGVTRAYFGGSTDSPIPGGYNGDGTDYLGIFRGTSGLWAIKGVTRTYFGSGSDVPVTR